MDMISMSRFLSIALVGFLSSAAVYALAGEPKASDSAVKPKPAAVQPVDPTRETLKNMTAELKLSEDQQKSVQKVLEANDEKAKELLANKKLTPAELGTKGREARAESDKQLKQILTAEQYQKWQKVVSERTIRRRPERVPGEEPAAKPAPPKSGEAAPAKLGTPAVSGGGSTNKT